MDNLMLPNIIGITGRAGSGKDLVANIINACYPEYIRYALACQLKKACKELFGWSQDQVENRVLKEWDDPKWGFSPRKAMQTLGTEFGRTLDPDLWLKFADMTRQHNPKMIITDVRFENEATWVRDRGGVLIHVISMPTVVKSAEGQPAIRWHISEGGVQQAEGDYVILNDLENLDLLEQSVWRRLNMIEARTTEADNGEAKDQ